MATYCMSDIHGEHDRYIAMLEHIRFSDADTLYIIGDVIDRYPGGVDILRDIMSRPNVHMILGNHEAMMLDAFSAHVGAEARGLWKQNGGNRTYKEMVYILSLEDRQRILRYVQDLPDHLFLEVNGKQYRLVPGLPAFDRFNRIWGRPSRDAQPPFPGMTTIVGHTPTAYLNGDDGEPLRIWHGNGIIDIDCGCGNKTDLRRLACLRLDDMAEFYV